MGSMTKWAARIACAAAILCVVAGCAPPSDLLGTPSSGGAEDETKPMPSGGKETDPQGGTPGPNGGGGPGAPPVIATNLPEHCKGPEMMRVDRAVATERPELGKFSYGFRFKAPSIPSMPVLVYLPGGPGVTSTEDAPLMLPLGWGYLLTDPRGAGCNTIAALPSPEMMSSFFRTVEIAHDVVAAIKETKLTNYVIVGNSFGTALGTHLAFELEKQKVTAPRGVVLEGVLGRAFHNDYPGKDFIEQWDHARAELPRDVRAEFEKANPYDVPEAKWLEVLPLSLYVGRTPVVGA